MTHTPEHGCPKCIIDDGRILAVLPLLVPIAKTQELQETLAIFMNSVNAHLELLKQLTGGVLVSVPPDYDGCHRATVIMGWVRGEESTPTEAIPDTVRQWTRETWQLITDIVSGDKRGHSHYRGN